jgi:pyridoxamine 5'-phosphate oxidase
MSHSDPTFEPPELEELLQSAWQALASGVADAAHGWHQAAISSLAADGGPDLRTVVVRSADPEERTIGFHTDARSDKIERLASDPRVGVLLYDRALRIQLRATGVASVHRDDALADAAWGRSSLSSRRCYLAPQAPSSALEAFSPNLPPDLLHRRPELEVSEGGRRHFALVLCRLDRMEWLHLRHDGHVRARFEWAPDGAMTATWLAP